MAATRSRSRGARPPPALRALTLDLETQLVDYGCYHAHPGNQVGGEWGRGRGAGRVFFQAATASSLRPPPPSLVLPRSSTSSSSPP